MSWDYKIRSIKKKKKSQYSCQRNSKAVKHVRVNFMKSAVTDSVIVQSVVNNIQWQWYNINAQPSSWRSSKKKLIICFSSIHIK